MTIDPMAITDREHPVVSNIGKIVDMEADVLILFIWFVRNISLLRSTRKVENWILEVCIHVLGLFLDFQFFSVRDAW